MAYLFCSLVLVSVAFSLPSPSSDAIRNAFIHAWTGYALHAWGHDEVQPNGNGTSDNFGGFGVTIVDALDTALLMDVDVVEKAVAHIARINFTERDCTASTFEYSIRYLGGLLGASTLAPEHADVLLGKAKMIADALLPAFLESGSGVPYSQVNLRTGAVSLDTQAKGCAILAEAGSIQLEFLALCEPKYASAAKGAMSALIEAEQADSPLGGLFPVYISVFTGSFRPPYSASLGGYSDSFYEILLKQWIYEGYRMDSPLYGAWRRAWSAIKEKLLRQSRHGHWFLGEIEHGGARFSPHVDHLSFYVPGILALAHLVDGHNDPSYLEVAENLIRTDLFIYESMATGLGPERVSFPMEGNAQEAPFRVVDSRYLLRPELVESLYLLGVATSGPRRFHASAWRIFESIEMYCKTESAYTGIGDVNSTKISHINTMESWFLAETLKYLYLILSSDEPHGINPREYVFTTEAHLLRLPIPIKSQKSPSRGEL